MLTVKLVPATEEETTRLRHGLRLLVGLKLERDREQESVLAQSLCEEAQPETAEES